MENQSREALIKICDTTGRDVGKSERAIIKENIIPSFLNLEDDGVERAKDKDTHQNGFLVLHSGEEVEGRSKHLALKAGNDKFWTISAVNGGTELEIGILEDGKHRSVISFNENAALSLREVLRLGAGLGAIEENGSPIGIPSSGFRGFKEGKLRATGDWESTEVKIPDNTFGKYKLQAWLIQETGNRFSHLETEFIFFPRRNPVQRIKNQTVNQSRLGQRYQQVEEWVLKRVFKKEGDTRAGRWSARLEAKIDESTDEILVKCQTIIDPDEEIMYYSIERLWEGDNWIQNDISRKENNHNNG